jgi:NADH dehydrogenase
VFGEEDGFYNRFAQLATMLPFLPSIGGGKTKFQPIYVANLADAIVNALELPAAQGRIFEIGGPKAYTFNDVMRTVMEITDRKRFLLPIPYIIAEMMGAIAHGVCKHIWPFHAPPLTGDQVRLMKSDNVVGQTNNTDIGTIQDLGVSDLATVEAIVPTYLWRYREYGQFHMKKDDGISREDA